MINKISDESTITNLKVSMHILWCFFFKLIVTLMLKKLMPKMLLDLDQVDKINPYPYLKFEKVIFKGT